MVSLSFIFFFLLNHQVLTVPTILDVAKRADVAPITVSRVINNSAHVSPQTRARVEEAIRELGYRPNRLARGLRLKQTHTLALAVTDITNPFWTTIVRGVEDAAHQSGFSVILCNTDESEEKQNQYLDVLVQKQVDGILLAPVCASDELCDWIEKLAIPVVMLDRRIPFAQVDVVRGDSEDGAYRLVQHLIALGHRRIAILSGPKEVSTAQDRVAGYCRALAENGLEICQDWIQYGKFSQASGYEMARQVLGICPCPTALFAANNFIAAGALRALYDLGLKVPEDVSVVAFDDVTNGQPVEPFLTAADQPAYEMGRRATELLLARLSDQIEDAYQEIVLPVKIIIRRSSGPPSAER